MPIVEALDDLMARERNHFFFGKLLTVDDFLREQRYFLAKRWLLNRLLHGAGTICGLRVLRDPDDDGRVLIEPGVGLDAAGREIMVPEPWSIDPSQPTDENGEAVGDPLDTGTVEICIRYRETPSRFVPVLVADCDNPGMCDHSVIVEGADVLVREVDGEVAEPPGCSLSPFPVDAATLHEQLAARLTEPCAEVPQELCLPLARVSLPLADNSIDAAGARPLVLGSRLLRELTTCLMESATEQASAELLLLYESGDGQSAAAGEELPERLTVRVVDRDLEPVADVIVQFEITEGGGDLSRTTVRTTGQGAATTRWTLGDAGEDQVVTARSVGTALTVVFRAESTS